MALEKTLRCDICKRVTIDMSNDRQPANWQDIAAPDGARYDACPSCAAFLHEAFKAARAQLRNELPNITGAL